MDNLGSCDEWVGAKTRKNYGTRRYKGKLWRAHRAAWDEQVGPIPDGLWVLHRCDNPPCIRVSHLYLGTAKDNRADCVQKRREGHAGGRPSKLTAVQVVAIRARYIKGQRPNQYDLAAEYGVSQARINTIVNPKLRKTVLRRR
jgi:hypothetical protein